MVFKYHFEIWDHINGSFTETTKFSGSRVPISGFVHCLRFLHGPVHTSGTTVSVVQTTKICGSIRSTQFRCSVQQNSGQYFDFSCYYWKEQTPNHHFAVLDPWPQCSCEEPPKSIVVSTGTVLLQEYIMFRTFWNFPVSLRMYLETTTLHLETSENSGSLTDRVNLWWW